MNKTPPMNKTPALIRFSIVMVLLFVIPLSLLRIIFWKFFEVSTDPLPYNMVLRSLFLGFKFDVRLSLLIVLPVIILAWIKPISPFRSSRARFFWCGYLTFSAFLVFLVYLIDFAHYAYFRVRLDSAAISLLEDTLISFQMVWESYPIIWIVSGLAFITALYAYTINRMIIKFKREDNQHLGKWKKVSVTSVYLFVLVFGIYGKISYYPLRWSDAFFSTNAFASSIALNPVLYFYDTFKSGGIKYNEKKVREHYDEIAAYLGVDHPDKEHLKFSRHINASARLKDLKGRPNVVMVYLESFAYYKTGLYGSPLNPTPHFDAIAQNGILFNRFFTPHWGTARSIFTGITGIPDVETKNTSTRNPVIVSQHTIINAFQGYEKYYFLGGSVNWGNIRGLLSNNIHGLKIYEEGSYKSPRVDVWGISDLALFKEANMVFRQSQDKPFFAIIQTAGNHRPYTIPDDNDGFQMQSPDLNTIRNNCFKSVEEFNAFRFLDHSIGAFIDMASKEKYFDNTIFVFFGDHGTRGEGSKNTPKWETQLGLNGFHVPLVIYAPKLIPQGKTYTRLATEMDILPTIAGLTLDDYENTTLGRDLLDTRFDSPSYAFIIVHSTMPEISILDDKFYFFMNDGGTNKRLHLLDSDTPRENVTSQFQEKAADMERLLIGLHETSKYMLYHNADK